MSTNHGNNLAVLDALMARYGTRVRETSEGYRSPCPVHDGDDQNFVLFNNGSGFCHSKCGYVSKANMSTTLDVETPPDRLTLDSLADAFNLPPEFLSSNFGLKDKKGGGVWVPYLDEDGNNAARKTRISLIGKPKYTADYGSKLTLYGRHLINGIKPGATVLAVEGESDCWVAAHAGYNVVGVPGATQRNLIKQLCQLATDKGWNLGVWVEPDDSGQNFLQGFMANLPAFRVISGREGGKDIADLWKQSDSLEAFQNTLDGLIDNAPLSSALKSQADEKRATELWPSVQRIIESDPLGHAERLIVESGYAGDVSNVLLTYVTLASPLLDEQTNSPMRILHFGPSSAGKSEIVRQALKLVPECAYVLYSGTSEKAFIHSDEQFAHRTVIMWEADSLPEDGASATALRSLLDGDGASYEVTVEDKANGGFTTVKIAKPGPTALICTSTKPLQDQGTTRVLVSPIEPSVEQVKSVWASQADKAMGITKAPDYSQLKAAYEYLSLKGERRVVIPFADRVMMAMPDRAAHLPRFQRDFPQLLNCIAAIAFLRQANRERDADGRVIAVQDDFDMARRLLSGPFAVSVDDGITPRVREVAKAVQELVAVGDKDWVSATEVGAKADIGQSQTNINLRRAEHFGLVKNVNPGKGKKGQWIPDDPVPDQTAIPRTEDIFPATSPGKGPEGRKVHLVSDPTAVVAMRHCTVCGATGYRLTKYACPWTDTMNQPAAG